MNQLTPEVFNTLIVINIVVGLLLAAFRFSQDMRRPIPASEDHDEYAFDENSDK